MLKSENLLKKLSDLERTLRDFSMEELPAIESARIQKSLASFSSQLEEKISGNENDLSSEDTIPASPEIIYHISSDLKRPLEDIIGCTDLLKESQLSREQHHYVDAILAASDILIDINNQLLGSLKSQGLKGPGKQAIQSIRQIKPMTTPEKYQTANSTHIFGQQKKLDLNPVLEDCLGQVELLEELVGLFKINVLEFIGEVKLHLQNSDFKGIAFASHKIKNGLKMLNASELFAIAEQMDILSKSDKDIKHLRFLFGCFIDEYPAIEKEIEDAIQKLKTKQG